MNRERKYRAWDKESERLVYSIEGDDEYVWHIGMEGIILLRHEVDNEENHFYPQIEVSFMDFTGLKDKNNKDRYEGDIIKRSTGYVFQEKIRSYQMGNKNNATCIGYDYHPNDEIIGNVFENPGLILEMKLIELQK